MIISGGSRSNWRFFSKHLMKAEENERVSIADIRGLAADTVLEAFRELDALASGTRAKNFFYHANINPRQDEVLTPEQWEQAVDTLEDKLGLTGHSRFIVEHEKEGRTHRHVVWSRIDPDTMTAVSDSNNYAKHEAASRELEQAFGHEPVKGVHSRDPEEPRPDRRPKNWETFRGHQSGIDPDTVKAELTELWQQADSGKAFAAALEEKGYTLAKGDKRDFCVIDQAGDEHSLARRIKGAKAKDIRERMADIDRDALPTVAEAREAHRDANSNDRAGESGDHTTAAAPAPKQTQEPEQAGPAQPDQKAHEPETLLQVAEDIAHEAGHAYSELAAEHGHVDAKQLIAETVIHLAADTVRDHWREWVAKARDMLHDESGAPHSPSPHAAEPTSATANASAKLAGFRQEMQSAMHENDGEPVGGLTVWQRGAMLIAAARDQIEHVVTAVKGHWQDLIDRMRFTRDSDPGDNEKGFDR